MKTRSVLAGRVSPSDDVRFDSVAAEQCLANIRAAVPTCSGVELEPCNRVYVGTLSAGQTCDRSDECAPVVGSRTYCLGVCKAARRASAGESCVRTCREADDCVVLPGEPPADLMSKSSWGECFTEDGLACVGGMCVQAPAEGALCLAGTFCDRGLECDGMACVRRPAIGEACGNCSSEAYCSGANVCTQKLATGSPCDEDEPCASGTCGRDACTEENCSSACQSATLGAAHGSNQECSGMVHL
jgi:hypothetical protein